MTPMLALLGCLERGSSWDSGDSALVADSGDTGVGCVTTAVWSASGLDLFICTELGPWLLGMAESGAGPAGWFGESCIEGPEPHGYDDYGYDYCHDNIPSNVPVFLAKADPYHPDNVVENESTLFTDSLAGNLTYVLATVDETGPCYVWGDDTSYYSGFGCEAI